MERKHWGQHEDGCFGCKLQTIRFDPYCTPGMLKPRNAPREAQPSWEAGVPVDGRGMPFLCPDGSAMGQKDFSEAKHRISEVKRKLHNAPATPN